MTHVRLFAVTRQISNSNVRDQGRLQYCETDHECQQMNPHNAHLPSAFSPANVYNETFNNVQLVCINGVCRQKGKNLFAF